MKEAFDVYQRSHPLETMSRKTLGGRNSIFSGYGSLLLPLTVAFICGIAHAARWQNTLWACPNYIVHSSLIYGLTSAKILGQYVQCDYLHNNGGNGGYSGAYCFYYYGNKTLTHYPNTPLRVDSDPNCPVSLPSAQTYLIKNTQTGKCVTFNGITDGSKVTISDCDTANDYPRQQWFFLGSLIRPVGYRVSQCLDVTDGNAVNGVKLQTWSCGDEGNPNQQWAHTGGDFLNIPDDHISWMLNPTLCMDLTDGSLFNGNPIQLWACDAQNPNQEWYLQPIFPQ